MTPHEVPGDDDLDRRLGELMDNARSNDLLEQAEETRVENAPPEPFATDAAERAEAEATTADATSDAPADTTSGAAFDPFAAAPEAPAEAEEATPDLAAEGATELADAEPVEADATTVDAAAAEDEGDDEPAPQPEQSPYDRPGDWYVVHTYAGYENKVKSNLANRIRSMHVEERIFEVVIPMEDVIEFKGGQRRVVQKKVFPGYLLVRMDLDDDSWYVVRNTPGVTGFVGPSGSKPSPLSRKEVEDILGVEKPEGGPAVEKKVRPRVEFEEGEQVRVVTGPFADFNGAIAEIDVDRSKLKVLVNIFGRETPVELEFGQVAKL